MLVYISMSTLAINACVSKVNGGWLATPSTPPPPPPPFPVSAPVLYSGKESPLVQTFMIATPLSLY